MPDKFTVTPLPVNATDCSHLVEKMDLSTGVRRCANCGLVLFIPFESPPVFTDNLGSRDDFVYLGDSDES